MAQYGCSSNCIHWQGLAILTENLRDFLTVGEAAEFLGVSAATLRNWDRAGKVRAARHPVNGYRLYRKQDLGRLLEKVKNGPDQTAGV